MELWLHRPKNSVLKGVFLGLNVGILERANNLFMFEAGKGNGYKSFYLNREVRILYNLAKLRYILLLFSLNLP